MGGGLRWLTWLLRRKATLRKPSSQQLGRICHLTAPVWIWGAQLRFPLVLQVLALLQAHLGPGCKTQSTTLTPKARFFRGGSKRPGLERQKETFPVWHRALRAQGIYSSASSARAASPSAAASAAEPLPQAGQEEEPCDFRGAGSQQRGSNSLCSLCKTPSPPGPGALLLPRVSTALEGGKGSRF